MNPLLLKQTSILSAILGAILGIITLIPFIRNFSFALLMLAIAAAVIIYMKRNELIGIIDIREGAILGAVIGFVSFIAFCIVFMPLTMLLGAIFKAFNIEYYTYGLQYFFAASGFFVLILLVVFMAILSALMNSFAGLITAYLYEAVEGITKEEKAKEENIDFEIKE